MKNYILLLIVLLYTGQFAFGAIEKFKTRVDGNSGGLVVSSTTPSVIMSDDKYSTMSTNLFWGFTNHKVKNIVKLGINPDVILQNSAIPNGYIDLKISKWIWNNGINNFEIHTTDTIIYLSNFVSSNTDIVNESFSYVFSNAHRIVVYINAVSGIALNSVYLSAEAEIERYYALDNLPVTGLSDNFFAGDPTNLSDANFIRFDWDYKKGAEFYELEWVHINSQKKGQNFYLPSELNYNYYMNSTRVIVKGNSYSIPIVFDDGYIVYRVRPIGRTGALFEHRVEGAWTTVTEKGTVASHGQNVIPIVGEYQTKLNWSHQIAYSDNGERFESITYSDGLGRAHQTLGLNTETNQTIVSNVYYDELGRAVISDLPTPVNGMDLKHESNFNLSSIDNSTPYNKNVFDDANSNDCFPNSVGFSTIQGSGKYYSTNNTDETGANVRVPDAEKYPFNRIVYANDLSGRLKSVSSAGNELKSGSGHDNKYAFPDANQNELDKLFGAEVGQASHYTKMVTVDANGQIYVQLFDLANRLIASYLAGENPDNLEMIDGNGLNNQTTQFLPKNTQTISSDLSSATFSASEYIYTNAEYTFNYNLTPEEFSNACLESSICLDCKYLFEFKILDACGDIKYEYSETTTGSEVVNSCNDNQPLNHDFIINLTSGEYQIVKKLSVDQQVILDNWCLYIDNNNCIDPISSSFNEEYLAQTFPGCTPEMESESYDICEEYKQLMLNDLMPGGQY